MNNAELRGQKAELSVIENVFLPSLIIIVAALMRLVPHPANVAPIAAMALFGGIYVDKKYALVIPLVALFLSDMVIGFYKGMPFVYGSFFLIGLIGLAVRKYAQPSILIGATLLSSILFFLITNFGVWLLGTIYPKTMQGLFLCYTAGLPFFRNTILGDLLYLGIFVIGYKTILLVTKGPEPAHLPQKEN